MIGNPAATDALLPYRRDAVASILMNLYVLASALRSARPVPRYLPSAAAARKKLLDRMAQIQSELHATVPNQTHRPRGGEGRRWADVYRKYMAALSMLVGERWFLDADWRMDRVRLLVGSDGYRGAN